MRPENLSFSIRVEMTPECKAALAKVEDAVRELEGLIEEANKINPKIAVARVDAEPDYGKCIVHGDDEMICPGCGGMRSVVVDMGTGFTQRTACTRCYGRGVVKK